MTVEGRTVDVRLIPFGEVARIYDNLGPAAPAFAEYDEEWMPGCFDHQLNAANRVHAKYGHSPHVIDVVGHGVELRRESDGYHVATKIHQTPQGDTTLELLRDGALPSVSLEAMPVRNVRRGREAIQRVKAHLTGFAFCRQGAFAGAQVLAVREDELEDEVTVDEMPSFDMNPELVERCRRLGIALPQRYEAHPDETDTPAEAGTSDDGTRHADETTSTSED